MHPIERLRFVARASGADTNLLAHETAGALAGFADDPPGWSWRAVASWPGTRSRARCGGCARGPRGARPRGRGVAVGRRARRRPHRSEAGRRPARVVAAARRRLERTACRRRSAARRSHRAQQRVHHRQPAALAGSRWWDDDDIDDPDADAPTIEVAAEGLGGAAADADVVALEAAAAGIAGFIAPAESFAAAAVAHDEGRHVWMAAGVAAPAPRVWDA